MGVFPWTLTGAPHALAGALEADPPSSLVSSSSSSDCGLKTASSFDRGRKQVAPVEVLPSTLSSIGQLQTAIHALSRLPSPPSPDTFVSLLKACLKQKSLLHVKQILACIAHHRIQFSGFLGDYVVVALAKCGAAAEAWKLSLSLPRRTVFSWSAIISAHVDHGLHSEALKLFQCMQEENVQPNKFTLVSLFKACGLAHNLLQGRKLHEYAHRKGFASDPYVGSSLVSMYGKCGTVAEAEDAFCTLSQQDIVSWTSMLSAYVEQGQGEKALLLYRQMLKEGMGIKELTSVIAIQACGIFAEKEVSNEQSIKVKSLELTMALHADAGIEGHASRLMVGNTLVRVYGKCKSTAEAEHAFCAMSLHDVVSWNAMLSAYVERCEGEKALRLFCQMHMENVEPEQLTLVVLLQACGALAKREGDAFIDGQLVKPIALEVANALHIDAHKRGLASDMLVGSTLLDVYCKCGSVLEAEVVFNELSQRNQVAWTALLFGYVEQGQIDNALVLYKKMQEEGVSLDAVALVSMLRACRECGSLELCNYLHFNVISSGYDYISGVQATLVYTYGSCASMGDAQSLFDGLLTPDVVSWSACIDGHASEGNSPKGLQLFETFTLGGRKPDEILLSAVLSACCYSGLLAKGVEYFESMERHFGLTPNLKHFGILVDLLARAGDLNRTEDLLENMPVKADLAIWVSLLGACRRHGNVQLARHAFEQAIGLQPKRASSYILMSNIYADAGLQECVLEVERMRQRQGAWDNEWPETE